MAEESKKEQGNGSSDKGAPRDITIHFETDPEYRVIAANGVWGGLTPRGDFKIDFFIEGLSTPQSVTYEIEGKSLGKEIARSSEKRFVRRLQVGVLLSPNIAESIADFIKQKLPSKVKKNEE